MIPSLDVAVPVIASGLLSLLGLAICLSGVRSYWVQYRAVSRAEQASGTIETVDIQPVVDGNGSTNYVPTVEYEYQTPTQRLNGTSIYPGQTHPTKLFNSESAANAPVAEYQPGTETTVYYDRLDPDHSFLKPTLHRGPDIAKVVFGLGLIGLGIVVLIQTGLV